MGRSSGRLLKVLVYGELLGFDGEAIELDGNIFPGFTSLRILQEIQDDLQKRNIEFEKFTDRIIFMSMFNQIDCTREGNDEICISNSESQDVREVVLAGTLDVPRSWMENQSTIQAASQMVQRFQETGHSVFTQVPVR